jgi:hypothetical protein
MKGLQKIFLFGRLKTERVCLLKALGYAERIAFPDISCGR